MAAYTSISARAKSTTAMTSAKAVKDAISAFQSHHGIDPANLTALRNGIPSGSTDSAVVRLPSDIVVTTSAITASTSEKTVRVIVCTDGYRIQYYKYANPSAGVQTMDVGNPTSCATTYLS